MLLDKYMTWSISKRRNKWDQLFIYEADFSFWNLVEGTEVLSCFMLMFLYTDACLLLVLGVRKKSTLHILRAHIYQQVKAIVRLPEEGSRQ